MAREHEQAPRAQRILALAAVGFLAAATALAFGRVFVGDTTWKLLVAAAVSAAVASLFERRGLLLATFASAAALLVVLGVLVFPHTTLGGLPTRETLRAIRDAMGQVGEQARVQPAPTPPLAPLLLAAITAVWTATFSAHALAVRAGSPVLAALPPVALLGFADTVMEDGARPAYAVLFLTAVLAVVFVDGLRRIRQWGPLWPWPGRAWRLSATTTRGARRVGLLAVATAVLLPGLLPGFGAKPLLDLAGTAADATRIDPLVSIQAQLTRREPVDLYEVSAPVPAYWRMLALDRFDGLTWSSSDLFVANGQTLQTPADLPSAYPIGGGEVQQTFRVLHDVSYPWLPMAYPPSSVDVPGGTVRYDDDLGAAVDPSNMGGLSAGDEYVVTTNLVVPTPKDLNVEVFGTPAQYGRYTYLPPDTPERIRDIALAWTADATTAYQKVLAIQDRLRLFTYSIDVKPRADSHTLVDFLTTTKTGFCQQFASAMAVLVRELGLPARVAVGFRPGTLDPRTGRYRVTTDDAHSWVEVLFPGYGWLAFEPTPNRVNPVAAPYLAPTPAQSCKGTQGACGPGGKGNKGGVAGVPGHLRFTERLTRHGSRGGAVSGREPTTRPLRVPWGLLSRVLAALAAAMLVLIPIVKSVWRRRRLHRGGEPRRLVLAAYQVFGGRAADLGLRRGDGETLAEYRDRLAATVTFSDGHLDRLTDVVARAAYSPAPIGAEQAREAAIDARTAIRDMRRSAGLLRRISGIYRPGL